MKSVKRRQLFGSSHGLMHSLLLFGESLEFFRRGFGEFDDRVLFHERVWTFRRACTD